MKHPDVARLMTELYFDDAAAKSVLLQIGFPPHMLPPFPATSFWSNAVILLEQGVVGSGEESIGDLIAAAAGTFPGNKEVQALHAKWSGVHAETGPSYMATPRYELAPEVRFPMSGRCAFVSYSHKDERYRSKLEISLAQIRREKLVTTWHDRKILPGQQWDLEIDSALERSDMVLLLASPDFLASDYAYGREMLRAIDRHKSGLTTVVPIIVRPCDWQNSPMGSLEALPGKGRPISSWANRDQAWLDVVQGLRRLISGEG